MPLLVNQLGRHPCYPARALAYIGSHSQSGKVSSCFSSVVRRGGKKGGTAYCFGLSGGPGLAGQGNTVVPGQAALPHRNLGDNFSILVVAGARRSRNYPAWRKAPFSGTWCAGRSRT
eukprot:539396-Amphidinium_carterae.2